jgi:hypothetical protein
VGDSVEVIHGAFYKGGKKKDATVNGQLLTYSFNQKKEHLLRMPLEDGSVMIDKAGVVSLGEFDKEKVLLATISGRIITQFNRSDVFLE